MAENIKIKENGQDKTFTVSKLQTNTVGGGVVNWVPESTAGGGTSDYEDLENKPSINGVELNGDMTVLDLGWAETIYLNIAVGSWSTQNSYVKKVNGLIDSDIVLIDADDDLYLECGLKAEQNGDELIFTVVSIPKSVAHIKVGIVKARYAEMVL